MHTKNTEQLNALNTVLRLLETAQQGEKERKEDETRTQHLANEKFPQQKAHLKSQPINFGTSNITRRVTVDRRRTA